MITYLAIIGIVLSVYMLYVRKKIEKQKNYTSICDINNRVNCTIVAKNPYGKTMGIENGILGIGFYLAVHCAFALKYFAALEILSIAGLLMTIYLLQKLYKLKMACPVCLVVHVLNIGIFLFVWSLV